MTGSAKGSPASRAIHDLQARIERLAAFEALSTAVATSAAELREKVGPELWDAYWGRLTEIRAALAEAEKAAIVIRQKLDDMRHSATT